MSIFNRLISSITGQDDAKPAPVAAQEATEASDAQPRRFMGRDTEPQAAAVVPEEKRLLPGSMIWIHIQPSTQRLLLVEGLGIAEGEELSPSMITDLQRLGWCEEVAYQAGYDQYWKMPSQEAILRTPSLHHIPSPLLNRIKLETKLVKQGEPRGFWMRVRMRKSQEMPQPEEAVVR